MKRTFIFLMSAAALIVVLALSSYGWWAQTQTYWAGGRWFESFSQSVAVTPGTGWVIAEAPYYSEGCNWRRAEAVTEDHQQVLATSNCPNSVPALACCKMVSWSIPSSTNIAAHAIQEWRGTPQPCGPVKATVQSSSMYQCAGSSPGE